MAKLRWFASFIYKISRLPPWALPSLSNAKKLRLPAPFLKTLSPILKFKDEFLKVQKDLTLKGNIVISVGLFGHSGDSEVWENMDEGTLTKTKEMLDDIHKRKIDMSDEIFVINVGGYIGDSTRSEIEYAKKQTPKYNEQNCTALGITPLEGYEAIQVAE